MLYKPLYCSPTYFLIHKCCICIFTTKRTVSCALHYFLIITVNRNTDYSLRCTLFHCWILSAGIHTSPTISILNLGQPVCSLRGKIQGKKKSLKSTCGTDGCCSLSALGHNWSTWLSESTFLATQIFSQKLWTIVFKKIDLNYQSEGGKNMILKVPLEKTSLSSRDWKEAILLCNSKTHYIQLYSQRKESFQQVSFM